MMFMGVGFIVLLLLFLVLIGLAVTGLGIGLARSRAFGSPSAEPGGSVRSCSECGYSLQRGWAHCPNCGTEIHWV